MSNKRNIGQKFALISAWMCSVLVVPSFGLFIWRWQTSGSADTWTPSLLSIVAFFACCAGVLFVVSRPKPPLPPEDAAPM